MKRVLSALLIAVLMLTLFAVAPASAMPDFDAYKTSGAFVYIVSNSGTVEITGCIKEDIRTLSVPAKIEGKKVTAIHEGAFWFFTNLKSITLPATITKIGDYAFQSCSSLTTVSTGKQLIAIGEGAFEGCNNLSSLPDLSNVTYVGASAFYGTKWYNKQADGVVYVGKVAYDYKGTCPAQVKIKSGTQRIAMLAFASKQYKNMKSIVIPKSVTRIGDRACGFIFHKATGTEKRKGFIIYGYKGTAAQVYAKRNSITFVALTAQLATPSLPTLKNTKNGVQVSWKKVTGAAKYRVFRKIGSGKWTKLADTTRLAIIDKTAKKGMVYRYTIRCISANGKAYTSSYNLNGRAIKCVR